MTQEEISKAVEAALEKQKEQKKKQGFHLFGPKKPKAEKPKIDDSNFSNRRKSVVEKHQTQIPYEITEAKGEKRVIIKKGKIPKSAQWIYWPKFKLLYWNNLSQLDEIQDGKKIKMKLVFDRYFTEPFNEDMKIERSPVVEKALINQSMDDFAEVVALTGFEITTKQIILMLAVALLLLPFGLSLNSFFHLVGNTSIHWLPSAPHFGK